MVTGYNRYIIHANGKYFSTQAASKRNVLFIRWNFQCVFHENILISLVQFRSFTLNSNFTICLSQPKAVSGHLLSQNTQNLIDSHWLLMPFQSPKHGMALGEPWSVTLNAYHKANVALSHVINNKNNLIISLTYTVQQQFLAKTFARELHRKFSSASRGQLPKQFAAATATTTTTNSNSHKSLNSDLTFSDHHRFFLFFQI